MRGAFILRSGTTDTGTAHGEGNGRGRTRRFSSSEKVVCGSARNESCELLQGVEGVEGVEASICTPATLLLLRRNSLPGRVLTATRRATGMSNIALHCSRQHQSCRLAREDR